MSWAGAKTLDKNSPTAVGALLNVSSSNGPNSALYDSVSSNNSSVNDSSIGTHNKAQKNDKKGAKSIGQPIPAQPAEDEINQHGDAPTSPSVAFRRDRAIIAHDLNNRNQQDKMDAISSAKVHAVQHLGSGTTLKPTDEFTTDADFQATPEQMHDADVYHMRGFQHRKNGDFQSAVREYTRAIGCNPRHFKAYFNRGFSFDKLGNYSAAIADYRKALEIDPANAYTYYNLGISFDRCGQYEMAVVNFTKALQLEINADFYHNRGFSWRKLGTRSVHECT